MKRLPASMALTAALAVLLALTPAVGAPSRSAAPDPDRRLAKAAGHLAQASATTTAAAARRRGFRLVGHSTVGGGGFNADVWAHRGFAYLGVWGAGPEHCPATGVKVADVRHPARPRLVARLANPAGTTAEDVVVRSVRTKAFRGDLAVTGIQACDPATGVFRGLSFWDVTKPARPRELGRWAPPGLQVGCHEVDLVQRPDGRVLAGCALVFAELPEPGGPAPTAEVRLVDVTNPRAPVQAGDWTLGRDLGVNPAQGVGCFPVAFAHSVRFFDRGRTVYVSYWDAGTINLDIRNPAAPRFVGRAVITPPDEDGDNHSMTLAKGGRLMLINPEDFSPVDCPDNPEFDGWGEVYVYDNRDRAHPRFLGSFSTPNSRSSRTDGFFSVHNTEVVRSNQAFSSWYSDGIVWWTVSNQGVTRQVGQFVPPAAPDPQGFFPTVPIVWGVYPDRDSDLILASDINSGLWILKPVGLGGF
jgi:hypothetical protein